MKPCMRPLFWLAGLLLCSTSLSPAQAIRWNALDYSPVLKSMGVPALYYGFGYEHLVDEYLSVTAEVNFSYTGQDQDAYYGYYNGNSQISLDYTFKYPTTEFAWQARYYFDGNTETSWYFSSGVSYKQVRFKCDVLNTYSQNQGVPAGLTPGATQENFAVFPLSIRLGHRGETDGFFTEYFIGFNFNIGDIKPKAAVFDYIQYNELATLNFCAGLNFGVGW